jgi:hypothetical protein
VFRETRISSAFSTPMLPKPEGKKINIERQLV